MFLHFISFLSEREIGLEDTYSSFSSAMTLQKTNTQINVIKACRYCHEV